MKKTPKRDDDPPKNDYARALDALTRYLALRDHSRFELETKLSRRFEPELVERLMTEAEANGWLASEDQVAERLVLALERRKKSRRYIEGELKKRKLPVPKLDPENEVETIRELLERKFGSGKLSFEERSKAYRFLKYRGFADRAIRQVLNEE